MHWHRALSQIIDDTREVRSHAIHLIDEYESGDAVAVGLEPDGFTLRLNASTAQNTAMTRPAP